MSLEVINARLDLVSHLLKNPKLREDVTDRLRRSFDPQRLAQKFSVGRGDADDLISLLRTIEATNEIADLLQKDMLMPHSSSVPGHVHPQRQSSLQRLNQRLSLDGPNELAALIAASVDEDGLIESHRVEETENADVVLMAQEVLQTKGSAEDQAAMSRVSRSKLKRKAPTDQEAEEKDTWILRRRYVYT